MGQAIFGTLAGLDVSVVHQFEEGSVHSSIFAQFRMERRGHGPALSDCDRVLPFGSDDFDVGTDSFDLRRSDKNHLERGSLERALADRTIDLTAVGVTSDADVECAQAGLVGIGNFLGQHDGTGASAKCGLQVHKFFELPETLFAEDFEEGTGLAAGNHQAVDPVQLLRLADQDDLGAEFFETPLVGVKVALDC